MYLKKIEKNQAIVDLTEDELGLLGNCLNEVCHGLKILDFESKIGIEKKDAQLLLKNVTKIYKMIGQKMDDDRD